MIKRIGYAILVITILLVIATSAGVSWFNNMWFKDKTNYLTYTYDDHPINFDWGKGMYGGEFEPHSAILIPVNFDGIINKLYLQLDTGAPTSMIYGKAIESLRELEVDIQESSKEDETYISQLNMSLGGTQVSMRMIKTLPDYGSSFDKSDTINRISIGTIGADMLDNHITSIDFKNQTISIYQKRPLWMDTLSNFSPFEYKGRRFMLPANILRPRIDLIDILIKTLLI